MENSSRVFKTKVDAGLIIFLTFIILGLSVLISWQGHYGALFFLIPFGAFLLYFATAIRYTVDGEQIWIQCRGFYKYAIPVSSIRKVNEIRSILSSPAASTDRLEITYNKYDSVMISPKDKTAFISALKALKPEIEVQLKAEQ